MTVGNSPATQPIRLVIAEVDGTLVTKEKLLTARAIPLAFRHLGDEKNTVLCLTKSGTDKDGLPGEKAQEETVKTGETRWTKAGKHTPENLGDKPFELILWS